MKLVRINTNVTVVADFLRAITVSVEDHSISVFVEYLLGETATQIGYFPFLDRHGVMVNEFNKATGSTLYGDDAISAAYAWEKAEGMKDEVDRLYVKQYDAAMAQALLLKERIEKEVEAV